MAHPKHPLGPIIPTTAALPEKRITQKQKDKAKLAKQLGISQELAQYVLKRWTVEEVKAHLNPDPIEFTPCYPDGTRPKPPEIVHTMLEAEAKGLPGTYFIKPELLRKIKDGRVYNYLASDEEPPEGYVTMRLYLKPQYRFPVTPEDYVRARIFQEMRSRGEDPAIDPYHIPKPGRPYGTTDLDLGKAVMELREVNGQLREVKVKVKDHQKNNNNRKESSSTLFQGPEDRAMKNRMRGYQ